MGRHDLPSPVVGLNREELRLGVNEAGCFYTYTNTHTQHMHTHTHTCTHACTHPHAHPRAHTPQDKQANSERRD